MPARLALPGPIIPAVVAELNFERALDILAGTPAVLAAVVTNLPRSAADERPAEGAWSPREVLAHLLHAETQGIGPRVKRLAEQDNMPFGSTPPQPEPGDPRQMSNAWADARAENLSWLRTLTPEQRTHVLQHPQYGSISVDTYVAEWAYHDLDHLRQILAVLAADLYPHIGPFQSLYAPPS
jgi:DinB family protein